MCCRRSVVIALGRTQQHCSTRSYRALCFDRPYAQKREKMSRQYLTKLCIQYLRGCLVPDDNESAFIKS